MRFRRIIIAIAALGVGLGSVAPAVTPQAAPPAVRAAAGIGEAEAAAGSPSSACLYFNANGEGRIWVKVRETQNSTNTGWVTATNGGTYYSWSANTPSYWGGYRRGSIYNTAISPAWYWSQNNSSGALTWAPITWAGVCPTPLP